MTDLEVHFEEFLHLAGLGHDKALIAWGGFYFRRGDSPYGEWRVVDDEELAAGAPTPRTETIRALRDWSVERATLIESGRRYDNRFTTFPPAGVPAPVTFAVLGDFGVGIVDGRLDGARQLQLAGALERAVDAHRVQLVLT